MYKIEALFVNPEYPAELASHNSDLVCYVVARIDSKVVDVAVVKRSSLHDWFVQRRAKYAEDQHYFVLGTTSIVGVLRGMEAKDLLAKAKAADATVNEINKSKIDYNPNIN